MTAVNMLPFRQIALLGACLVLMGALGGCQSARYRMACANAEPAGHSTLAVPQPPEATPRPVPPHLEGPSEPLPPANSYDNANRPPLPPGAAARPEPRGFHNGPALNAGPEDLDDEEDEPDDAGEIDEPIFPKGGRLPPRFPADASNRRPGDMMQRSSAQTQAGSVPSGNAPRYQLPVTRFHPSSTAKTADTIADRSDSAEWSTSLPIPLANPPALRSPPTERR